MHPLQPMSLPAVEEEGTEVFFQVRSKEGWCGTFAIPNSPHPTSSSWLVATASLCATPSGHSAMRPCSACTRRSRPFPSPLSSSPNVSSQTGDQKYYCDPHVGMYAVDCVGFRRSHGALETLLQDNDLADHPGRCSPHIPSPRRRVSHCLVSHFSIFSVAFAQAKVRGIRSLAGHSETTDVSNDVNGGPSGVGVAATAGKAMFWDVMQVHFLSWGSSLSFTVFVASHSLLPFTLFRLLPATRSLPSKANSL
jgi:hypothetical protein